MSLRKHRRNQNSQNNSCPQNDPNLAQPPVGNNKRRKENMDYRETMPNTTPADAQPASSIPADTRWACSLWITTEGDRYWFRGNEMVCTNPDWVATAAPTVTEPAPELRFVARFWFPENFNPNAKDKHAYDDIGVVRKAEEDLGWFGLTPEAAGEKLHYYADWFVANEVFDDNNNFAGYCPFEDENHLWHKASDEEIAYALQAIAAASVN